ncbi:hypothetical protein BASA81_003388 [Batrachochytrium salamandrivorans]|nr:hypothetical protein BASA81_003388 [Batrachochytrium salamandrivorans]
MELGKALIEDAARDEGAVAGGGGRGAVSLVITLRKNTMNAPQARQAVFEQRPTHPRRVPSVDGFGEAHKHGRTQRHEGLLSRAAAGVVLFTAQKELLSRGGAHARFANLLVNYCDEQGTVQKQFQGGALFKFTRFTNTLLRQASRSAARRREEDEEEGSSSEGEDSDDDQADGSLLDLYKLPLKPDHEHRPLWVTPKGGIYLERRSQYYAQAYEFLAAVGEPVTRSEIMHEWKLTKNSLHSASSVELTPEAILDELEKLSKIPLALELKQFVCKCADSYGKVKLVLVRGRMFVESSRADLLRKLLTNVKIKQARMALPELQLQPPQGAFEDIYHDAANDQDNLPVLDLDENTGTDLANQRWRFEINPKLAEQVKNAALGMDLPLMEEFDYKQDATTPTIQATLNLTTEIRPYQAKCLAKMFSKSLAKSGLFVLPCGSGKTLSAIAAVCTMKKSSIIVCSSTIAVEQFKRQFHQFSNVAQDVVCRFTSKSKDVLPPKSKGCVLLTTYSMLAVRRKQQLEQPCALDEGPGQGLGDLHLG